MPKFTKYKIDLSSAPERAAGILHQEGDRAKKILRTEGVDSPNYSDLDIRSGTISNNIDIVQQNRLFTDPKFANEVSSRTTETSNLDSIYGKAKAATDPGKKSQIAESYKTQSDLDTKRYTSINLIIDGKTVEIQNVIEKAKQFHKPLINDITDREPTMDMIVDYLQGAKNIIISDAQRNFLRTQWNQMSFTGAASSLINLTEAYCNPQTKQNNFIIEKGRLVGVECTITTIPIVSDDKRSGQFAVFADISHLQSEEKSKNNPSLTDDDWLPKNQAKVSISYESKDGLEMELSDKVVELFPQNKNLLLQIKEKLMQSYSNFMSSFSKKNKTAEYIAVNTESNTQESPKNKKVSNLFSTRGQIRASALLIRGSKKSKQKQHTIN